MDGFQKERKFVNAQNANHLGGIRRKMTNEFTLIKEREKWLNKWYGRKVTARALGELKQTDIEWIILLKKNLSKEKTYDEKKEIYAIIDNIWSNN